MNRQTGSVDRDSCGSAVETSADPWDNSGEQVTPREQQLAGVVAEPSERSDMDILPPSPTPSAIPRSDDSAPLDGCPNCVRNVEEPRLTTRLIRALRGHYDCSDCGHAWTTDWAV